MSLSKPFTAFATHVSRLAGRPGTFVICLSLVVVWAVSGPMFGFSDTWQLVINTSTTIVTFLMVFLIQNTQNRDNAALQAKLDELIRASNAHNRYVGIEKLTDKELEKVLSEVEHEAAHSQSAEAAGKRMQKARRPAKRPAASRSGRKPKAA